VSGDYEVRLARPEDVTALPAIEAAAAGLFRSAGLTGPFLDQVRGQGELALAQREARLFVAAARDGRPVGFALGVTYAGAPHLEELDVHPEHGKPRCFKLLGGEAPARRGAGLGSPQIGGAVEGRERLRREREAIVRRHMESENVHDFDTVLGTFSHPRYEIVPTGAVHDGEAAVRAYFRDTRATFPDQRNELIALHHADDAVIAEFWLRGTHRGALGGLAPTGRAFECRMVALFLFDATGIVCERVYFDSATILRQLGGTA
jgi:steroid delta-isomerase-like uncharacterized protein